MLRKLSRIGKFGDQRGFTLIEIIAVLVILAVLAVVAVPKYMSAINDAKSKAAMGAVAEGMGRASQYVAQYMLASNGAIPTSIDTAATGSNAGDFNLYFGTPSSGTYLISAIATTGNASGGSASAVGRLPQ
jgi:prepilin-type N-terminal cleavage/methylation domain-containing protein